MLKDDHDLDYSEHCIISKETHTGHMPGRGRRTRTYPRRHPRRCIRTLQHQTSRPKRDLAIVRPGAHRCTSMRVQHFPVPIPQSQFVQRILELTRPLSTARHLGELKASFTRHPSLQPSQDGKPVATPDDADTTAPQKSAEIANSSPPLTADVAAAATFDTANKGAKIPANNGTKDAPSSALEQKPTTASATSSPPPTTPAVIPFNSYHTPLRIELD